MLGFEAPGAARETCSGSPDCHGAALRPGGRCLAHLDDNEQEFLLKALAGGALLDGRGVNFSNQLLSELLGVLPRVDGRPRIESGDLTAATFSKGANLSGIEFGDGVRFDQAVFATRTSFAGAVFAGHTSFKRATFGTDTDFSDAAFGDDTSFAGCRFGDSARFDRTQFGFRTSMLETNWGAGASFSAATFGERARFDGSVFMPRATFCDACFGREASLRKVEFGAKASFERASFAGEASYSGSKFGDQANFADAKFATGISFRRARFGKLASFRRAAFGDRTWFTDATFASGASFNGAVFAGRTRFNRTAFAERVDFEGTTFSGQTSFEEAMFEGRASFRLATFERARTFGPLLAGEALSLAQSAFLSPVRIEVSTRRLIADSARFPEGVDLRVRWADIALDQADFGAPGVIASPAALGGLKETVLSEALESGAARARLVSLRGANVAQLAISGIDLGLCRFSGAHNLDQLRLEGGSIFERSPRGTSNRSVIAEEQEWRASSQRAGWPKWKTPVFPLKSEGVEKPKLLSPNAIASIYRDLRKGKESSGDAPGAADFYFGEMEMRRKDPTSSPAERLTVWLYWLVAGYGLRSLRALGGLLVTIVLFAFLLRWVGFSSHVALSRSLLYSAESTSNLFRTPETPATSLTQVGEALQIALRLLGPLFFGLALLSLRGRIRR
jgi:hypothetical protein